MPASLTLLRDQDGRWAHPYRPGDCSTHDHRDVSARCAGVQLRDTPPERGYRRHGRTLTPPGVKPGSRTPHRYGPSPSPHACHSSPCTHSERTAVAHRDPGRLWWPVGPTAQATSSASMVCTTCRPSRLPGARRPARAAPPTPRPGGHLLGRPVVVGVLRHGGFLLLFELLGDAAHLPHRRHRTGPRPQPLQEPTPLPRLAMAWSSAMARGMARAIGSLMSDG
jgi:hypothetical protein